VFTLSSLDFIGSDLTRLFMTPVCSKSTFGKSRFHHPLFKIAFGSFSYFQLFLGLFQIFVSFVQLETKTFDLLLRLQEYEHFSQPQWFVCKITDNVRYCNDYKYIREQ